PPRPPPLAGGSSAPPSRAPAPADDRGTRRGRHHRNQFPVQSALHSLPLLDSGRWHWSTPPAAARGRATKRRKSATNRGHLPSTCRMARNASCGISTEPTCFMRFLPAFCFSKSFLLRV